MKQKTPDHEVITRIVSETLVIEPPEADVDLFEKGYLDSLSMINLIVALEKAFGISISAEELNFDDLRTIQSICLMMRSLCQTNGSG